MRNLKKYLGLIVFLLLFLFLWQIGEDFFSSKMVSQGKTSIEVFIPTPKTIFKTIIFDANIIFPELFVTLYRAFIGFLLGSVLAVLFVFLMYFSPLLRSIMMPIAFAINSFPIIGFSPLIIMVFGQGSSLSIIFVSALIAYFPALVSLEIASREIRSQSVMELMKILNATRFQVLQKIIIPNSVPYFFISAKLSLPASIMGAVIGEWLGANSGIGRLMIASFYQLKPGLLYGSLLLVVIISCSLIFILSLLEKKYFFFWNNKD